MPCGLIPEAVPDSFCSIVVIPGALRLLILTPELVNSTLEYIALHVENPSVQELLLESSYVMALFLWP